MTCCMAIVRDFNSKSNQNLTNIVECMDAEVIPEI